MFKEATFKNLIITEHWPSNNYLLKGSFSTSSHSLCTEYRSNLNNSLLNFRNACSQSSIVTSSEGLSSSAPSLGSVSTPASYYSSRSSVFTSQRSLLDTIKEEKEK